MPGRRVLSDAQLIEMAELREAGWTADRIAKHFTAAGTPVGRGSIIWQCMRVGADLPEAQRLPNRGSTMPRTRYGRNLRPFQPDEDQRLLQLEADGLTMSAIGVALGRRQSSVRARLMRLARHDSRREEACG